MASEEKSKIPEITETVEDRIGKLEVLVKALTDNMKAIPDILTKAFEAYDTKVKTMIPVSNPTSNPTGFLELITEALKKVGGGGAQTAEINDLANKIVVMALRNTLRNVDKAMGGAGHIVVEGK